MNARLPALIRLLVPCLVLLSAGSASAAKIKVGKDGIDTIQSAVAAAIANADADDVILIPPGVYDEAVFITLTGQNQDSLTLQKSGKGEVKVRGVGAKPAIQVADARGVRLRDLRLESGSAVDGVAALEISGTVFDLVGEGLSGVAGDDLGVAVLGTDAEGVLLEGCDFSGMLTKGFLLDGSRHRVQDSRADGCGENALVLAATSARCRVDGFKADASGAADGTDTGVVTVRGADHVLRDVAVSGGGDRGIAVHGDGHRLSGCQASGNVGPAFDSLGGRVVWEDCEGTESLHGLLGGGDGMVVRGGDYSKNSSHGILFWISGEASVDGASFVSNLGNGVMVMSGVDGVDVLFSTMKANGGEAVRLEGSGCWVEGNVGKKGDGFVDAGSANGGRDNQASDGAPNDLP